MTQRSSDISFRSLFDSLDLTADVPKPSQREAVVAEDLADAFSQMFVDAGEVSIDVEPEEQPLTPDEHAQAELAKFKATTNNAQRAEIAEQLATYAANFTETVVPRAIAGRMFLELDRHRSAQELLKSAHEHAPQRSDVLADLRLANSRIEARRVRSTPHSESYSEDLMKVGELDERKEIGKQKRRDQKAIVWATLLTALMIVFLYYAAVEEDLGHGEHVGDPRHLFFWTRIFLLVTISLFGVFVVTRHRPLRQADFAISWKPTVGAVLAGAILGGIAPITLSDVPVTLTLGAVLIEVVAVELYFRLFLGRALNRGLVGSVIPVVASGFLFAAFQLTYLDNYLKLTSLNTGLLTAGLALVWGLTIAAVHKKTESAFLASACHWTARAIVLIAALP